MSRKIKIIPPVEDSVPGYFKRADTILASATASADLKAKAQALNDLLTEHSPTARAYNTLLLEANAVVNDFNARVEAINATNKALSAFATQLAVAGTLHINDASALGINNV